MALGGAGILGLILSAVLMLVGVPYAEYMVALSGFCLCVADLLT